jgi:ribosome modulation factor
MTEYEKGYEAAICGKALDNCPFHSSAKQLLGAVAGMTQSAQNSKPFAGSE